MTAIIVNGVKKRAGTMTDYGMVILAGGRSRRMGRDKASLPMPSGETVLEQTAKLAVRYGGVLVVGRAEPDGWTIPGVTFLPDDAPDEGPAAGLLTALRHPGIAGAIVALSCDLPLLRRGAIQWLKDATAEAEIAAGHNTLWHGLIPVVAGRWQPLFASYVTAACLPLLEANLSRGERSLRALIEAGNFTFVEMPPEVAGAIANVNTPEDWARIAPQ